MVQLHVDDGGVVAERARQFDLARHLARLHLVLELALDVLRLAHPLELALGLEFVLVAGVRQAEALLLQVLERRDDVEHEVVAVGARRVLEVDLDLLEEVPRRLHVQ